MDLSLLRRHEVPPETASLITEAATNPTGGHVKKMTIRTIIFVITLLLAVEGYCDNIPEKINLSRGTAVAMAIRNNLDLRNEVLNFSMAEKDVARSWGIYNPVLNTSVTGGVVSTPGDPFFKTKSGLGSIGVTQSIPTGGSITALTQSGVTTAETAVLGGSTSTWQSTVGINISQPLLKNFGMETTELSITLAANTLQDSLERFRSTTTETVLTVINSYNHLYALRQVLESKLAALNSAQALLDEIQKRVTPSAQQSLEIANAEFAITQRRKDLVDAERNIRDQEAGLRYLIGIETKTQIIPIDSPSRAEPQETEEQAIKAAIERRTDLKQLRLALKTSQLQERVARHQTLPDLSITGGGGLSGSGGNFGESYSNIGSNTGVFWSAGMQFSMPLGNSYAKNDYLKSKIRTEQVQTQLRALEWKIRNDVEADMRALISARLQLQTADRSLQLAEQRRDEYRKQTQAGASTVQDVINAENDLTSARNGQMDATETFANAVAKLWRDTGELLDRQGIHIDTLHPEKPAEEKSPAPPPVASPPAPVKGGAVIPTPGEQPSVLAGKEEKLGTGTGAQPASRGVEKVATAGRGEKVVAAGTFTLKIGEYVVTSAMSDAKEKIKSVGLSPVVKEGPKKKETMIRLYIGEFPDQNSARKELKKLHNAKADGFFIMSGKQKCQVYAGSYYNEDDAEKEQKRLAGLGINTSKKKLSVSVQTFLLTAGSFPTREAALKEAAKLEAQGLKPVVMESGK